MDLFILILIFNMVTTFLIMTPEIGKRKRSFQSQSFFISDELNSFKSATIHLIFDLERVSAPVKGKTVSIL